MSSNSTTECLCGRKKDRRALKCTYCHRSLWTSEEETQLRILFEKGWEFKKIAKTIGRTKDACMWRARKLKLKRDPKLSKANRLKGIQRFHNNPTKVARRRALIMETFTPQERAIRAEEARQRNSNGTFSFKGRHHTPAVRQRMREINLGRKLSTETRRKQSEAAKAQWARRKGKLTTTPKQPKTTRPLLFDPVFEASLIWCAQCDKRVSPNEVATCVSRWCKAKRPNL